MSDGQMLGDVLSSHFKAVLRKELDNQSQRIENIGRWEHIYRGYREPKIFPWVSCANVAVPITRVRTDTIFVRIIGAIWDRSKVWLFKALKSELIGLDREIEDAMDWFQKNILKFKQKMLSPILQCVKTGTGIIKIGWEEKRRAVYRYATDKELKNKNITKYQTADERKGVIDIITEYIGPQIYPVDRKDFFMSSDAASIQEAYVVGFKFPLTENQLKHKVQQGLYYEDAVEKIKTPSEPDNVKEKRAEAQGKEISYERGLKPYDMYELWTRYDVNEDGNEDDIVLTMNLESGALVKAIYNPLFKGFRPFIDYVFYPSEYLFDGEGVVEILEKPQIEIDSMHNQRLDRITCLNAPMTFIRRGSGLDNFQIQPGKVEICDTEVTEDVIREFKFSDQTFSSYPEEDRLVEYCNQAVGTPPISMGFSESERPVFKESIARKGEADKKFYYGVQNIIYKVIETGYMLLEFFAQYQPEIKYETETQEGIETRTVNFPVEYVRDGFQIEIAGARTLLTQEERLHKGLTKYQLLSDYYTKTAGMVMAIGAPTTPVELKVFLSKVMEKGDKLISDILADFDEKDVEEFQVNAEEFISNAVVRRQPLPMPPQGEGEKTNPFGGVKY